MWTSLVLNDDTVAARPWTIKQWSTGDDIVKRYIIEENHWTLATLFEDCGGLLTEEQWGSLELSATQDKMDQLLTNIIRDNFPISCRLDKAIQIVENSRFRNLAKRLTRAHAGGMRSTLPITSSRRLQLTPNPGAHGSEIPTSTPIAAIQNRYTLYLKVLVASSTVYDNILALR